MAFMVTIHQSFGVLSAHRFLPGPRSQFIETDDDGEAMPVPFSSHIPRYLPPDLRWTVISVTTPTVEKTKIFSRILSEDEIQGEASQLLLNISSLLGQATLHVFKKFEFQPKFFEKRAFLAHQTAQGLLLSFVPSTVYRDKEERPLLIDEGEQRKANLPSPLCARILTYVTSVSWNNASGQQEIRNSDVFIQDCFIIRRNLRSFDEEIQSAVSRTLPNHLRSLEAPPDASALGIVELAYFFPTYSI